MREAHSYGQRLTDDFDFYGIDPDPPMFPPTAWQQAFGAEARHDAWVASMTDEKHTAWLKSMKDHWDVVCKQAGELGKQAGELQRRLTEQWRRECAERRKANA